MRLSENMKKILVTMVRQNAKDTEGRWTAREIAEFVMPEKYRYRTGGGYIKMEPHIYRPLRAMERKDLVEKLPYPHGIYRVGKVAFRLTANGRAEALKLKTEISNFIHEWTTIVKE